MRWRGHLLVLVMTGPAGCGDDGASMDESSDGTTTVTGTSTATVSTEPADETSPGTDSSAGTESSTGDMDTGTTGGPASCAVRVDGAAGDDALDGSTWDLAKQTVAAGLTAAAAAQAEPCDVWVRAGTYQPTTDADRTATFALAPGIGLYGGFDGTETALEQRDPTTNVTILSGDIGTRGDSSDNAFHVVTGADGARIDGFTIRDGRADDPAFVELRGAGILAVELDLVIARCIIENNTTGTGPPTGMLPGRGAPGGGIYQQGGSLRIENSVIRNNASGPGQSGFMSGGIGGEGAGIFSREGALHMVGSTIMDNVGGAPGAGMLSSGTGGGCPGLCVVLPTGDVEIRRCDFVTNLAGGTQMGLPIPFQAGFSGGMYYSAPLAGALYVIDSTFDGNVASHASGLAVEALGSGSTEEIVIVDSIFVRNVAFSGGAGAHINTNGWQPVTVANAVFAENTSTNTSGSLIYQVTTPVGIEPVRILDTIFWSSVMTVPHIATFEDPMAPTVPLEVDFTNVQGGCMGSPNLSCGTTFDLDPSFVDAPAGDVHLQAGSLLQDLGDLTLLPADALDLDEDGDVLEPIPFDHDGNPRVVGMCSDSN